MKIPEAELEHYRNLLGDCLREIVNMFMEKEVSPMFGLEILLQGVTVYVAMMPANHRIEMLKHIAKNLSSDETIDYCNMLADEEHAMKMTKMIIDKAKLN